MTGAVLERHAERDHPEQTQRRKPVAVPVVSACAFAGTPCCPFHRCVFVSACEVDPVADSLPQAPPIVVVARAVADSMLRASSQLTVLQCESPPPTIAIISITLSGTSTRVDTGNVTGRIDIHFAVDLMPANTVPRLRVGGGSGLMLDCPPIDAATQTGVCTLDTAVKDGEGALIHANGPQPVSVRMVRPDGTTIASEE